MTPARSGHRRGSRPRTGFRLCWLVTRVADRNRPLEALSATPRSECCCRVTMCGSNRRITGTLGSTSTTRRAGTVRARLGRILALLILLSVAVSAPATARTLTGPTSARAQQLAYPDQWSYRTGPEDLSLWFAPGQDLPAGTVINLQVTGCGGTRAVPSEYSLSSYPMTLERPLTTERSIIGTWEVRPAHRRRSLGPRWNGELTITLPDTAPSVLRFDHDAFDFSRDNPLPTNDDTCPAAGTGDAAPVRVQHWSTKTGRKVPAVGNRLTVSATRAAGARVSYAWKVGAKVVDRDRALKIKRGHRGKAVSVRITASKAGATSVTRMLRYGRAR